MTNRREHGREFEGRIFALGEIPDAIRAVLGIPTDEELGSLFGDEAKPKEKTPIDIGLELAKESLTRLIAECPNEEALFAAMASVLAKGIAHLALNSTLEGTTPILVIDYFEANLRKIVGIAMQQILHPKETPKPES